MVMIMGEISTSCYVDIPSIARNVVLEIGYDRAKYGFDGTTCSVLTSIDEQSKDIAPVSYTHLDVYKRQHICCILTDLFKQVYKKTAFIQTHISE